MSDKDIMKNVLERFEKSESDSAFLREEALEDFNFSRLGAQWPEKIRKQREEEGRPVLTINKHPAFIRQVVNSARQNKPSIVVAPVDNGADVQTAEIISGIIRSIERGSRADIAYDTAIDHSATCGFGFFRIVIDYVAPLSFDMKVGIERIPNPLSVHWDTSSTRFDSKDWKFAFVSEFIDKDEFEMKYPKAAPVSFDFGSSEALNHWVRDDEVRVAEYWCKYEEPCTLIQLSDGRVFREDQLPVLGKKIAEANNFDTKGKSDKDFVEAFWLGMGQGVTVKRTRKSTYSEIKRHIVSGVEVLEEDVWPGSCIPICPVWGEEVIAEGRRYFRSMVRDARDPQRMFNFWRSASTELVALAPKAPWVGPVGFVPKDQEAKWESAHTRSYAYLEYEGGTAPQRTPFAGVPAGALQESLNASDDMKAIFGIYDPSLGARSNETSGVAINARKIESSNSNFHFIDNLSRAIKFAGEILVEIIPSVYSEYEVVRILGEDMKEKVIKLKDTGDGSKVYDITVGQYDVTVKAGPSHATQREETKEVLIDIMRELPESAPVLGDILLEHMDFPQAGAVAKRLKTLLPPEVREAEMREDLKDLPEDVRQYVVASEQKVKQAEGQMQQLAQELQTVKQELESKQLENQVKAIELGVKKEELLFKRESGQQQLAMDAQHKQEVEGMDQADGERIAQAVLQTLAPTLEILQGTLQELASNNSAPVAFERDANGRVIAVSKGDKTLRVVADSAGRVMGAVPESSRTDLNG